MRRRVLCHTGGAPPCCSGATAVSQIRGGVKILSGLGGPFERYSRTRTFTRFHRVSCFVKRKTPPNVSLWQYRFAFQVRENSSSIYLEESQVSHTKVFTSEGTILRESWNKARAARPQSAAKVIFANRSNTRALDALWGLSTPSVSKWSLWNPESTSCHRKAPPRRHPGELPLERAQGRLGAVSNLRKRCAI